MDFRAGRKNGRETHFFAKKAAKKPTVGLLPFVVCARIVRV
jgi:hypothetical protein